MIKRIINEGHEEIISFFLQAQCRPSSFLSFQWLFFLFFLVIAHVRLFNSAEIDRGHRPFFQSDWSLRSNISTIAELSSSIRAHISSAIAGGESRLQLPSSSVTTIFKMFFKRGTAARSTKISDQFVKDTFKSASKKKSGWLTIFCLEMNDFHRESDGGLSSVGKELNTLSSLSGVTSRDLKNLGLRDGAMQLLQQLANSVDRADSVLPSPSPSPSKSSVVEIMDASPSSKQSFSSLSDAVDQLENILDMFFASASKIHKNSGKSRLDSESALSKLRTQCLTAFEEFLNFHQSVRQKRNRTPPSSDSDQE